MANNQYIITERTNQFTRFLPFFRNVVFFLFIYFGTELLERRKAVE